jgi:hypothetical protein
VSDLGRALIILGILLVAAGGALSMFGRMGLPRLPGDILIRRDNVTIYVPIATALLVSIVASLVFHALAGRR